MYIQLNSQVICYEKTGEGSPVILIHGNKGDHHTFDALAETMSNYHTVYAMDSRGYGESATPKEYHYKDMAEDVINLINALDIEKPYLIGFSDGGIIALLIINVLSNYSTGSEVDYYLVKETAEAAGRAFPGQRRALRRVLL